MVAGVMNVPLDLNCTVRPQKNLKGGENEEKKDAFSFDGSCAGNPIVFHRKRRIWG
jgi:hypothetical protein